jgi:hypothetical protein
MPLKQNLKKSLTLLHKKQLKATTKFNAKIAQRLVDSSYYRAQGINMKEYAFIEREKRRLSTPKWDVVTDLIKTYKTLATTKYSKTAAILEGLYKKKRKWQE